MNLNTIYCENNLETMARMPDGMVDLVVTSPPYDNLRKYNGYSFEFEKVARELYRVVKVGGVVVWVVSDATVNGSETGTSFRQALYFMQCGFNLHDTMIYAKSNPIPLKHNRYQQCYEYMFVFSKGTPHVFNPLKVKTSTNGLYTHGFNRDKVKEGANRNRNERSVTREDKTIYNIWFYSVGNNEDSTEHPAAFPEQLAADHIYSWSNPGELVYDPFGGSGTTAKMCILHNRNYILSEISPEYVALAEKRLQPYKQQLNLFAA
jgi:DNA modification methylase